MVLGALLAAVGLPMLVYGIYMLFGDNYRSAKFVAGTGILITILGIGLIGNALGLIKD